jgi:hypothetical protein
MKKIFVIGNQQNQSVWTGGNRSVVGVEIEGKTLKIRKLKGINPTLEGFLYVLREIREELNKINNEFVRKSPYKIEKREGMSGCKKWEITFLQEKDGFWIEKRNVILHVSCFGKVPDQDIFIPDLALIIDDLLEATPPEHDIQIVETEPVTPETAGYVIP